MNLSHQLKQMCLDSGGSEPLQGGGRWHDGPSWPIIRKLNLNVNGALSFSGLVGGVENRKIGGDNIAGGYVPSYRLLKVPKIS